MLPGRSAKMIFFTNKILILKSESPTCLRKPDKQHQAVCILEGRKINISTGLGLRIAPRNTLYLHDDLKWLPDLGSTRELSEAIK